MSVRNWQIPGIAVCIAAGLAYAQQGNVAGPVSGIVFDRASRQLRPVLGIPGASLLGDPIVLGVDAASAWVAPLQNAAFVAASDGKLHWFRFEAGRSSEIPVGEGIAAPQAVIFSPFGNRGRPSQRESGAVIKGLPDAPAPAGNVELPSGHAARPVVRRLTLAISDDASYLLFGAAARFVCLACPARIASLWILTAWPSWHSVREAPTRQWSIPEVRAWCFSGISRGLGIRKR